MLPASKLHTTSGRLPRHCGAAAANDKARAIDREQLTVCDAAINFSAF